MNKDLIKKTTPRIVIFLNGGLVQEIYTDQDAEIIKIDLDIDGAEDSDLTTYPDRESKNNRAYIAVMKTKEEPTGTAQVDKEYVDKLFDVLDNNQKSNPLVENPKYPVEDWKYEVQSNDTRLGYNEWVSNKTEEDS